MNINHVMSKALSFFTKAPSILLAVFILTTDFVYAFKIESYLSIKSLEDFLLVLLNVITIIAIPIVVLFIIYAGFLYVTARGNAEQIQQATRSLTYAIIGGIMILGAVAVGEIVKNVVDSFTS